ncbi:Crp/Fnr family transcriptional regulator [Brevundimonas sp. GCM10030266]|uniref:Crp/Fnr family transcriptional regulator n=1 Tax=Brevundimonas sp. GCM10030266 TaxID=3273386 RepID=UPI00360A28D4
MPDNYFLDRLAPGDRDALIGILRPVSLRSGEVLIERDRVVDLVHFPVTAQLANVTLTPDGEHLETAVIGKEGLSGLAPVMARTPSSWQVNCTVGGSALVGAAEELRALADRRPGVRHRLLVLTHFYQAQANQLALCNILHRVPQRAARWLLTTSDLTGVSSFEMTQEQIAEALGVQRTSMVEAFGDLKKGRILRHTRSRFEILDRPALIRRACGCYAQLHDLACDLQILPRNR